MGLELKKKNENFLDFTGHGYTYGDNDIVREIEKDLNYSSKKNIYKYESSSDTETTSTTYTENIDSDDSDDFLINTENRSTNDLNVISKKYYKKKINKTVIVYPKYGKIKKKYIKRFFFKSKNKIPKLKAKLKNFFIKKDDQLIKSKKEPISVTMPIEKRIKMILKKMRGEDKKKLATNK